MDVVKPATSNENGSILEPTTSKENGSIGKVQHDRPTGNILLEFPFFSAIISWTSCHPTISIIFCSSVATTNVRKPRFTIMGSSRPTLNTAQRMQRRDTQFGVAAIHKNVMPEAKKPIASTSTNGAAAKPLAPASTRVRLSMAPRGLIKLPSLVTADNRPKPPSSKASVQTKVTMPHSSPRSMASSSSTSAASARSMTSSSLAMATSVAPNPPRKTISQLHKTQSANTQVKFTMPAPVSNAPMLKLNSSARCTYCDKKFVKEHALNVHLQDKCDKITPIQRRQLLQKIAGSIDSKHVETLYRKARATRFIPNDSRFFLDITNEAASGLHQSENSEALANGLNELKASMKRLSKACVGITRTPSKSIKCHICSRAFLNCVEYATHIVEHQSSRVEI